MPKRKVWLGVALVVWVIVVTTVGARVQAAFGYYEPSSYIPVGIACGLLIGLPVRLFERWRRRRELTDRA